MFGMVPIAKFIYTALFLLLFGGLTFFGVRAKTLEYEVRSLNLTVAELQSEVEGCKAKSFQLDNANSFLRSNLERLNAYYRRKPKPQVVVGEIFNVDNLFLSAPR